MIAAALLFSKQIAAIDRKAKAKDTGVLNEAKRNEKRVDFDSKGCGLSVTALRSAGHLENVQPGTAAD